MKFKSLAVATVAFSSLAGCGAQAPRDEDSRQTTPAPQEVLEGQTRELQRVNNRFNPVAVTEYTSKSQPGVVCYIVNGEYSDQSPAINCVKVDRPK